MKFQSQPCWGARISIPGLGLDCEEWRTPDPPGQAATESANRYDVGKLLCSLVSGDNALLPLQFDSKYFDQYWELLRDPTLVLTKRDAFWFNSQSSFISESCPRNQRLYLLVEKGILFFICVSSKPRANHIVVHYASSWISREHKDFTLHLKK